MMTETLAAPSTKKPRRQVAKSTGRREEKAIKTAVNRSPESMRRLAITSVMENKTQSELVDELIRLHLRKYVVQTRDRAGSEDSSDQATQGISAAA